MATHSGIPAWRTLWREEHGRHNPWGYKESNTAEHAHTKKTIKHHVPLVTHDKFIMYVSFFTRFQPVSLILHGCNRSHWLTICNLCQNSPYFHQLHPSIIKVIPLPTQLFQDMKESVLMLIPSHMILEASINDSHCVLIITEYMIYWCDPYSNTSSICILQVKTSKLLMFK